MAVEVDRDKFQQDTGETPEQAMLKMNIMDFFIFSMDPSRDAIYTINKKVREYDIKEWFKNQEPNYYIEDQDLENYLEE